MVDNSRSCRACMNNNSRSNQNRCNMGGCNQESGAERSLVRKLQMIDFAIVDTVLYLNAYPHSRSALSHYKKLTAERAKLCEALARASAPITHRDELSDERWSWTDGPWPWDVQAN